MHIVRKLQLDNLLDTRQVILGKIDSVIRNVFINFKRILKHRSSAYNLNWFNKKIKRPANLRYPVFRLD